MKINRCLVAVLFLLPITVPVAFADADDPSLDDIRQQSAISSSYNFSPLPSDAGKGIIVAIISQGISRSIEERLGDRLSAYSALLGDDSSPYEDGYSIGNDGVSVVGALAPMAGIINVKALNSRAGGSYENIRKAIIRAAELGANIIVLPIRKRQTITERIT